LQCSSCENTYLFYKGKCLSTCPEKTYSTDSTCEGNLKVRNYFKVFFQIAQPTAKNAKKLNVWTVKQAISYIKKVVWTLALIKLILQAQLAKVENLFLKFVLKLQDCQKNCQSCNSEQCLNCETNYLLYKGNCLESCPDKTYSTGSICQSMLFSVPIEINF